MRRFGQAMAALAAREGVNPLFELETGRISEADVPGRARPAAERRPGPPRRAPRLRRDLPRGARAQPADDRLHAGAARAQIQDGDLHQQHPGVGAAWRAKAPGGRDLRGRRGLLGGGNPQARASHLRDHARAPQVPAERRAVRRRPGDQLRRRPRARDEPRCGSATTSRRSPRSSQFSTPRRSQQ